jgi:Transcriptional regulator, AbiEi antitoxin, Type IV TA system/Transcriptional regulator, AbiEi antitoxin N-terminal domain
MSEEKSSKLNSLQRDLPEGLLVPTAWLRARGYSDQLLNKYRRSGWLQSPARGVYRRPGPPLKWQNVVASLDRVMAQPPHVGGLSALELRGYAHFLKSGGPNEIHLYSKEKLPAWLSKLPLDERFIEHSDVLFDASKGVVGSDGKDASEALHSTEALRQSLVVEAWGPWDWNILYAVPERAFLELLDEVPQRESVEHAAQLMSGLADLSSRRVIALLGMCRSVKVKRLFLALASRQKHHWVARVVEAADRGEIDLGTGKRALVRGGKLDPKYLITLPETLDVQS